MLADYHIILVYPFVSTTKGASFFIVINLDCSLVFRFMFSVRHVVILVSSSILYSNNYLCVTLTDFYLIGFNLKALFAFRTVYNSFMKSGFSLRRFLLVPCRFAPFVPSAPFCRSVISCLCLS